MICTIGPASENPDCIRGLIREGMNVARINFSHCKYDEALARLKMLREARAEMGVPLAIMLDTKGPEVRMFGYSRPVALAKGDTLYIESTDKQPDQVAELPPEDKRFYTNLPRVNKLCRVGSRVLLQDGFIEAEVTQLHEAFPGAVTVRTPQGAVDTGLHKLGAILGDRVQTGCNSVTSPGTLIGPDSFLMPNVTAPSGVHPRKSVIR
jgi:pyruvate kinase